MADVFAKQFKGLVWGRCLLFLLMVVMSACAGQRPARVLAERTSMTPGQAEAIVFAEVNRYRRSRGRTALVLDARMNALAREHARWMASRRKLSHRGSGGRFRELNREPMRLVSIAENVAFNLGHGNPARVAVDGWLRSSGHKKNILRRDDRLTGVGVARSKDGAFYFTQIFGHR